MKWILGVLGFCIVALLFFAIGVSVGYRKAEFSYQWKEGYNRNFGRPPSRVVGFPPEPASMMNAHGVAGSVIQVAASDLVIVGRDGMEKTVTFSPLTMVRNDNGMLRLSDFKVGDQIIVIGAPGNEGRIEARFIRVFR